MKPRIPAPGYIAIECSTCDPPSVVHVREDAEITLPYSCTVCIKRGLRRLVDREQPLVGRMKHGSLDLFRAQMEARDQHHE